jgi:hypothetical protein
MVMVVVIFWYIGLWCSLWPWSHFSISVFHWFGCVLLLMSLWTWYILLLVFWLHWSCSYASTLPFSIGVFHCLCHFFLLVLLMIWLCSFANVFCGFGHDLLLVFFFHCF